jgi:methyl-accepting chemotaxis protein
MVPNIQQTADLVQEITAASTEQSTSVAEINRTVSQLDEIAQQNASASEELASTAVMVQEQTNEIRSTVSFFKLVKVEEERLSVRRKKARTIATPTQQESGYVPFDD